MATKNCRRYGCLGECVELRYPTGEGMKISEQDIKNLTDAVSNDVDEWVRDGAGTYEDLSDVVERAIRRVAERETEP